MVDPLARPLPNRGPAPQARIGAYEIEGELGRGGMGVVYLARDTRLGRRVALKSLIDDGEDQEQFLARFRREARVLAEIEHPNVGAIHGLEEDGGRPYLVLEYVPGETLAELLARGPLTASHSLDVCAQIAAALEAAHARGVVHRDLKPANVKIRPDGTVKVLDFGLAKRVRNEDGSTHVPSIEVSQTGLIVGTIAYMSPEQLRGLAVDARTDVWALGCVLYECLTGRRAFVGASAPDTIAAILEGEPDWDLLPRSVSAHIDGLLHRALSKEPRERPRSAAEFAAEIPGSPALRAALAAGRMPTPEMVAAAGGEGGLSRKRSAGLLALTLAALSLVLVLGRSALLQGREPLQLSPDALGSRAREILAGVGWNDPPRDAKSLFFIDSRFLADERRQGRPGLRRGRASATVFCQRSSPMPLAPTGFDPSDELGDVTPFTPPLDVPGMANVFLDGEGRLVELAVVPPARTRTERDALDWTPLFAAAGIAPGAFQPTSMQWEPPVPCDERAAWLGADPDDPGLALRVEAAASAGRPVYFKLFWPWTEPRVVPGANPDGTPLAAGGVYFVVALLVLAVSGWLARFQVHRGVADRRGAIRLAAAFFCAQMVLWAFEADHVSTSMAETHMFTSALGLALFDAAVLAVAYVAFEPFVRRRWPWRVISLSRLLSGRWRDRMVARDVAVGLCVGTLLGLAERASCVVDEWFGGEPTGLMTAFPSLLGGEVRYVVSMSLQSLLNGARIALLWSGVLFLVFRLVRREWLAFAFVFACAQLVQGGLVTGQERPTPWWSVALVVGAPMVVFARLGVLALAATVATALQMTALPPVGAGGSWYALNTFCLTAGFAAAVAWACWSAVERRPATRGAVAGRGGGREAFAAGGASAPRST